MLRLSRSFFQNSHFAKNNADLDTTALAAKAGFLRKDASGLYSLLHMGVLAQQALEQRLRQTFDRLGAAEVRLSLLQDLALWQATGRVDSYEGELMITRLRQGGRWALNATAEELVTAVAKDLFQGQACERWVYQIGTKWRDELRCRAGLVRAREFTMLDAYSFSASDEVLRCTHEETQMALIDFFTQLGLRAERAEADTGQMGGTFSEEIRVASNWGDDDGSGHQKLEVAHSFLLGDRYSRALGFTDRNGSFVRMGCQGVGVSRTLMAWLDQHRDAQGFYGTAQFSATDVVVVAINQHKTGVLERATALAQTLEQAGWRTVLDDREERAGKKLADSELVGTRWRVVVSDRDAGRYEWTERASGTTRVVEHEELLAALKNA